MNWMYLGIGLLLFIGIMLPLVGTLLEKALTQNEKLKKYIEHKGLKDDFVMWQTEQDMGRSINEKEKKVINDGLRDR